MAKTRKQTGPPGTPYPKPPPPRKAMPQSGRYGPIDTRSIAQTIADLGEGLQIWFDARNKPKRGMGV